MAYVAIADRDHVRSWTRRPSSGSTSGVRTTSHRIQYAVTAIATACWLGIVSVMRCNWIPARLLDHRAEKTITSYHHARHDHGIYLLTALFSAALATTSFR